MAAAATAPATGSRPQNDIQRIGLFSEVGYITIGDPYRPTNDRPYHSSAGKGKQMMTSCTKSKTGLCDGYFQSNFGRVFEKEAWTDPIKRRRHERILQSTKNIDKKAFYPSNATKKPSGLGNYYGTFGGTVKYFNATTRSKAPYKSPGKNFLTTPIKKGSGYGYNSLTIGKDFEYMSEYIGRPDELRALKVQDHKKKMISTAFKLNHYVNSFFDRNPFKSDKPLPPEKNMANKQNNANLKVPFKPSSPAKAIGNCKAGTFTPYPRHPVDGFEVKTQKPVGPKYGIFRPSPGNKSRPADSVLNMNVKKRTNVGNYRSAKPQFNFR